MAPYNNQLQRTVKRRRGDGASAPFHYALAPRCTRQRAAAELRRLGAMRMRHINAFSLAAVAVMGCATHPAADSRQMETCIEGAIPADVSAESFSIALKQAQRYSDEKYGSDCFVCAEVFDRPDEYMLHITSPIEDMLINTSAAITVRKTDGAIAQRAIWHSCHARIKKAAQPAPNTSYMDSSRK